jgi:hypothetical protein
MRVKWYLLGAGACLLQLTNCAQLASETAIRIGMDLVFLPINSAIITAFNVI